MLQVTEEKVKLIRGLLKTTQSRQKSYAGKRHSNLVFQVGNSVLLRVFPMEVVVRFGKHGNLNPHYVGPFEIVWHVGAMAYRLALP